MKVTNVCPGPVETNFNKSSFGEEKAAEVFGGARDYDRLTAEEVAKAIIGAASVADNVQVVYLGFLQPLTVNLRWKKSWLPRGVTVRRVDVWIFFCLIGRCSKIRGV